MTPDAFQQAWKAQTSETRVTINADALRTYVQRSQQSFRATILLRDLREALLSILMIPLWFYLGYLFSPSWTWYLTVPALVWVSGFIIVDRMFHKQKALEPDASLLDSVHESLVQVEHQIWLLRNVAWWYLFPFAIPIEIFFLHTIWTVSGNWFEFLASVGISMGCLLFLYVPIYYLNQYAVRKQLEPRRRELFAVLNGLSDEAAGEVSGEFPILTGAPPARVSPWRVIVACVGVVLILGIGVPAILFAAQKLGTSPSDQYLKRSPFEAVRWEGLAPQVKVDGEWFVLVSLEDIPASEIVAFSQKTYGDLWQKRFEEDLVELLAGMGHGPEDTVTLELTSLTSGETRTLENVPLTYANRAAIRNAAQERARESERSGGGASEVAPLSQVPLGEALVRLRAEHKLVGLAAMVMVDGKIVESAADGERSVGSGVHVAVGDEWHLGSITKSMTATTIGRLVESGRMDWSDTVGTYFSDGPIREEWKAVTLRQLLTHRSGAPANFPLSVRRLTPAIGAESMAARREAVLDVMAKKPETTPGESFAYSNVGFTIAGAMAEAATDDSWSDLVTQEVFEPLGLESAGFGPPKSSDEELEQPRGHRKGLAGKVAVDDSADNTFIMGPAGIARMTLEDLCTYGTEHMRGERGEGTLLSAETYQVLHTPELERYACGWVRYDGGPGIPHPIWWHNGSNTMWYALVVFVPETKMVIAVASNDGDVPNAEAAAWELVRSVGKQVE